MYRSILGIKAKIAAVLIFFILLLAAGYGINKHVAAESVGYEPVVISPAQATGDQVIHYRGDPRRTGAFADAGLRQMNRVRWQTAVGRINHGPPVFADGTVYVMSSNNRLMAIDSQTGNSRWAMKPKPSTPQFSSVAVAGGVVYVGQEKRLYAVNAETGAKLWKAKTSSLVLSAPLVVEDTVYFGCFDGQLYAVNAVTGKRRWRVLIGDSDTPPVFDNGTIYTSGTFFGENRSFLYALDAATGQQRWRIERTVAAGWDNGIAVANGLLYVGAGDGRFYALNGQTGEEVWSIEGGSGNWSGPAVVDAVVYVGNQDKRVRALNSQTGELVWQFEANDSVFADPIVSGGVIYFGDVDPTVEGVPRQFYALDSSTGQELWRFQASGMIIAAACVGDGAVYFATSEPQGTLYAIE